MASSRTVPDSSPAPVTCPGCHSILPAPADQCPRCGYNAWTCVDRFPYSAPPLDRYIDVENRLSNEDRAKLDRLIDSLESDLPQVRVHVCLVKLLPGTDARECGFWMFNSSIPRDEEEAAHRPWSVLLLLDLNAGAASATVGYGLDPFVSDHQLRAALNAAQPDWEAGSLAGGTARFVQQLHHALRHAHRHAGSAVRRENGGTSPQSPRFSPPTPPPRARHPES